MATKVTKDDKEKKEKKISTSKKTTKSTAKAKTNSKTTTKAKTNSKTTTKAKSTSKTTKTKTEVKPRKKISITSKTKNKVKVEIHESTQGTAVFPITMNYKYLEESFNNLAVLQWLNSIYPYTWSISSKTLGYDPIKILSASSGSTAISTEITSKSFLVLTTAPALAIYCIPENEFKKLANIETEEPSNTKYKNNF